MVEVFMGETYAVSTPCCCLMLGRESVLGSLMGKIFSFTHGFAILLTGMRRCQCG